MKQTDTRVRRIVRRLQEVLLLGTAVGGWTVFGPRSWAMDEVTREALESLSGARKPMRRPDGAAREETPVALSGVGCCACCAG